MAVMRAMFDAEVTAACGQMRAGAGEDLHLALFGIGAITGWRTGLDLVGMLGG
jgi:hypothetical protein